MRLPIGNNSDNVYSRRYYPRNTLNPVTADNTNCQRNRGLNPQTKGKRKGETKMKYYQVKKEYDNFKRPDGSIYIGMELYTEREVKKLNLNRAYMDIVDYPRHLTFFTFGCRRNVNQDYKGTYALLSRNRD